MTHINTRRDTAANWASVNPVLQEGELGFETNTRKFKFGNGVSAWNDLLYAAAGISATKADVGLGAVDNTSDMDKPISTTTQTALNAKAPLNSPAFTGNPTAPTPATSDNDTSIATTAFVNNAIAASDANLSLSPVVSIVLVANDTLSGLAARDGYTPVAGDLVLATAQTAASANGIYVASASGWTRWTGANSAIKVASLGIVQVQRGTLNGGTRWATAFKSTDTLGTTAMVWFVVSTGGWISWVPTFTAETGALGAATLDWARYQKLDHRVDWSWSLSAISAGTGAGGLKWTLPVPASVFAYAIGSGMESGVTGTMLNAVLFGGSTTIGVIRRYDYTTPIVSGYTLRVSGSYEPA